MRGCTRASPEWSSYRLPGSSGFSRTRPRGPYRLPPQPIAAWRDKAHRTASPSPTPPLPNPVNLSFLLPMSPVCGTPSPHVGAPARNLGIMLLAQACFRLVHHPALSPCPAWSWHPGPVPVLQDALHFHCPQGRCTPGMTAAVCVLGLWHRSEHFTCITAPKTTTGVCLLPGSLGDRPAGNPLCLSHLHATQVASGGAPGD